MSRTTPMTLAKLVMAGISPAPSAVAALPADGMSPSSAETMPSRCDGPRIADKALLTATSPALNAERIKTPLFIAQGARDPRVNIDESNQMVKALKARGVDVPYMVKDNEGHGFHNEENQFDFYEAMERFLAKHLAEKRG